MPGFIQRDFSGFGAMLMICILISAVTTGTGFAPSVLCIIVGFPISISERMACRCRTGISAGTGTGAGVLRIGIVRPCTVSQTVAGVFRGAVRTGGTEHRALMLGTGIVRP